MPLSHLQDRITLDRLLYITNNFVLRYTGVTAHGPVLSLGNWSAMFTICWVILLLLFWRKSGCSESKLLIQLSAHGLTSLPCPYRLHSYVLNTHHFPCVAKCHGLAARLLLCSDVSLNPGPISLGAVNGQSVINKDHASIILYQHILLIFLLSLKHTSARKIQTACCIQSTPMVTNSATNPVFMSGVAMLDLSSTKQFKSLESPAFSSFENISIAIGLSAQPLVLTCVY